jgi:uncharacterized lipoprotein YmbA
MKVEIKNNLVIVQTNDDKIVMVMQKKEAAELKQQLDQISLTITEAKPNEWQTSLSYSGKDLGWGAPK